MGKTYYLIHIYFEGSGAATWTAYSYRKSRRFTAKQAWQHIHRESNNAIHATGKIKRGANLDNYWNIIEELNLDKKVCDRYCTFGFIK